MSMKTDGLGELELKLNAMGKRTPDVCKKALKAGAKVLREGYRRHLSQQNVSGQSKHELENSFVIDSVKGDELTGFTVKVHPDGYNSKGEAFDKIAKVLEYGRGSKQEAMYPWMAPTNELMKTEVTLQIKEEALKEMEKA